MASILASCLRDLIRLAQELKQSVDKIPQNRRNARKLSEDLIAGLTDIETFYGARSHVIEATPELEETLASLLSQTQAVRTRCEQFLNTTQQKGWRKIGAALNAWRECDQVEQELAKLKDTVHQCYRKFTMMAISRLEQPINQINLTTTTPDRTASQLSESQNVMLGHVETFLTTLQTLASTAGSPILIQPQVVDALYLHQQVENISNSLSDLSATQTFAREEPNEQYLQPFKTVIANNSFKPSEDAHRDVVAKTLEIIRLLKGDSADLSVQDGAWEMVNLAIKLYGLEMYSDAEAMGRWTVTMFRALVATNQDIYEPYLALALRNLSRYKGQINDDEGSTAVVAESLEIQRRIVQKNPTLEIRSQLSNTLNEYWSIITKKGDNKQGLELARESVAITDSIRAEVAVWKEWLEAPSGPPPPYIEPAYVQVDDIELPGDPERPQPASLDEDETMWLDFNTARALCCLAYSYQDNDRIDEAYETQLKSLALYQKLHQTYGGNFEENVAGSCAHLCSPGLREGRDNTRSIVYAERALEIYRRLVNYQPVKVSPWYLELLWDYAELLHNEGRKDDVVSVTQEALEIVRKPNQNRKLLADALHASSGKLRRLEQKETAIVLRTEAVGIYRTLAIKNSPSSESQPSAPPPADAVARYTVPDSLMDLANDYLLVDKEADAVLHCQDAVDIFRTNLKKAPDDSDAHLDLARGLSYLCYCTFRIKEYDAAVKIGNESITIYRQQFRTLGKEFKAVENYVSVLRRSSISSFYATGLHAILVSAAVIEDLLMLTVDHKDKVGKTLFYAFCDRDYLLGKHGRVRESLRVNEQVIGLFTSFPIIEPGIAADYISAHGSYAGNLQDLGRSMDAVRACEKAIDLGNRFTGDEVTKELACALAGVRATYSILLYNSGRYVEADEVMRSSVKASRDYLTPAEDTLLACRLRTYATIRRRLDQIDEALKLNEEAVTICRNTTSKGVFVEARLPYNLESFAASMLEFEDHQKALTAIQEAMELYRKFRDGDYNPMVPWHYCEPIYAEALTTFANCLMATGDFKGAHEALTEVETLYRDIVTKRPGQFADQTVCWDLLAFNMHALGLHVEAKRISDDLAERLQAMEMFNSEVALLAHTALDELRSRPSQVRLRASFGDQ